MKRTKSHQIDTVAKRVIEAEFPVDWLLRTLDERDYGIDLSVEVFDGNSPTGDTMFVQVKGTEAPFNSPVKLSGFPTKTLEYARLFNVPFFLFYTSITDKKTYYVWLQKYAEIELNETSPEWRNQNTVTIHFPQENTLEENKDKILGILLVHKLKYQASQV